MGGGIYGSCLNLATMKFQMYLLKDILIRGADTNRGDEEGNTSLHYIM
jgi:hypothetical protein